MMTTLPVPVHHLFVGIDIAATSFTASWLRPGASPSTAMTFPQTPAGFTALQQQLAATSAAPAALVVMEATGFLCAPYHGACNPSRREDGFERKPMGQRLTSRRKPTGTAACRRSGAAQKTCMVRLCKTRVLR